MVGAWLMSLVGVVFWEHRDTARPASAIVVLGAAQYVGRPSPVLRARIDHAIDLWRRGLRAANHLHRRLRRSRHDERSGGRPALRASSAVFRRAPSSSKTAGARPPSRSNRSPMLMEAEPSRDVILVSDPFHMLRLSILARRFGMTPYTSPTRTSPISLEPARVVEVRARRIDQGADRVPAGAARVAELRSPRVKRADQPRPVGAPADLRHVVVARARHDQQLARAPRRREHLASHRDRNDQILIAVRDPHRNVERGDARDRVEMDARDRAPRKR